MAAAGPGGALRHRDRADVRGVCSSPATSATSARRTTLGAVTRGRGRRPGCKRATQLVAINGTHDQRLDAGARSSSTRRSTRARPATSCTSSCERGDAGARRTTSRCSASTDTTAEARSSPASRRRSSLPHPGVRRVDRRGAAAGRRRRLGVGEGARRACSRPSGISNYFRILVRRQRASNTNQTQRFLSPVGFGAARERRGRSGLGRRVSAC